MWKNDIQAITGHLDEMMTEHYNHLQKDDYILMGGSKNSVFETAGIPAGLIKGLRPLDPVKIEFLGLP